MQALFAILFLAVFLAPALAQQSEFIISYWCGPPAGEDPEVRYTEVAECNFNYCLPPCSAVTVEQNKAILDACARHGLKYIIGDSRIMSKDPDDPGFGKNLDEVIADYGDHPATGGYFVTDEPNAALFPKLAAINQYLLKKDPKHLPFINLFPDYASEAQLGNPTYEEHVAQFCSVVKPRILSYDHYIMMSTDPEKPAHLSSYFQNMQVVRDQALKNHIPACFIMLLVPHGSYRNPTIDDLRWQIYTALAYGYKAILYFTYWTPSDATWNFRNAILDENGNRTEHFDQVKRLNAELRVLGSTLRELTSIGVYHTGDLPAGCSAIPPNLPIQLSSDQPCILGVFRHRDGSSWAMIVNRSLRKPGVARLTFDPSVKLVEEMSAKTGVMRPLGRGQVELRLLPGEGKLIKLKT